MLLPRACDGQARQPGLALGEGGRPPGLPHLPLAAVVCVYRVANLYLAISCVNLVTDVRCLCVSCVYRVANRASICVSFMLLDPELSFVFCYEASITQQNQPMLTCLFSEGLRSFGPWGRKIDPEGHGEVVSRRPYGSRHYARLHDTILYRTILYYNILYYTIIYYTILSFTTLYYTIL